MSRICRLHCRCCRLFNFFPSLIYFPDFIFGILFCIMWHVNTHTPALFCSNSLQIINLSLWESERRAYICFCVYNLFNESIFISIFDEFYIEWWMHAIHETLIITLRGNSFHLIFCTHPFWRNCLTWLLYTYILDGGVHVCVCVFCVCFSQI